jgi:trans-aconitate 2-methyltransferase
MAMIQWDSELYLRYERERTQPSIDLVSKIGVHAPSKIIDLGCGPGNSTRILRERWPSAHIVGLDSSPEMIERAKKNSADIEWKVGDIQSLPQADRFDLIFANASLHWLDDHRTLIQRLMKLVEPSGVFAFQMPALYDQPAAQAVHNLAISRAWSALRLAERYKLHVDTPGDYYNWLSPLSRNIQIWETNYFHELPDHQAIVEFYSSTGLKPYLEGIPSDELSRAFKAAVLEAYKVLFPSQRNGKVLFQFRRLFVVAVR